MCIQNTASGIIQIRNIINDTGVSSIVSIMENLNGKKINRWSIPPENLMGNFNDNPIEIDDCDSVLITIVPTMLVDSDNPYKYVPDPDQTTIQFELSSKSLPSVFSVKDVAVSFVKKVLRFEEKEKEEEEEKFEPVLFDSSGLYHADLILKENLITIKPTPRTKPYRIKKGFFYNI